MFTKLTLHHWRQFELIDINFHPRLTVLTGANGSGKTTILHMLNRHWGWNLEFVSDPDFDSKTIQKYRSSFWGETEIPPISNGNAGNQARTWFDIGQVQYQNGQSAVYKVPTKVNAQFNPVVETSQPIHGVFVPSHRQPYIFQTIREIPTTLDAKEQLFQLYLNEVKANYTGNGRERHSLSPAMQIKRSLISLATFGYGNAVVEGDADAIKTFEGFEEILRHTLPPSLGFKRFRIKIPDVLLETASGTFSLEAVSGGVAAIIDMVWQIYLYSLLHDEFVVVIDEPETHLHPELQQRLLPDLLNAFPRSQFIIATHNPFMVTAVADSNVYVLRYNANNRVESTLLDQVNKAGTADDILMDVLGIPSTIPNWAANKLDLLFQEFQQQPLTQDSVTMLRRKLNNIGLSNLFPKMLADVAEAQH